MTRGVRGAGSVPVRLLPRTTASIATLAVALAAACGPGAPPERAERVLSVGYAAPSEAGVATGLGVLIDQLTRERLFRSGPDGRVEPMLAKTWSVDGDGTAVTVVLRRDVVFHDGSPVTSDDVKTSLDRVRVSPPRIARNPVLGDIESIETDGPHRVVINLARSSEQLQLLGLGNRIEKPGPEGQRIATGPFIVESTTDNETTLRANPYYRQGRSQIDTVRMITYPTLRTAWAAMMRSEVDFLFDVPIEAREFVEADSSVRVFSRATPYAYALVFNTRRPPFDDPRVRVALSYAIDREAILESTFRGYGSVASGIWPSHWVYGGVDLTYGYDPRRADRLLAKIGLTRPAPDGEGPADAFPSRLHFEALVSVDQPRFEPIALMVQKQLRQIGVDMATDARPFAEVNTQVRGDSWDAVLLPLNTARNLSRLYLYWHSSQRTAVSGFTGADDALESLRSSVTEAATSASASEFQRVLFEAAPAIFLTRVEQAHAVSRRFVVPDEPGRDVMETLWQWRVADQTSPN